MASSLDRLQPVIFEAFRSPADLSECLAASANVPEVAGGEKTTCANYEIAMKSSKAICHVSTLSACSITMLALPLCLMHLTRHRQAHARSEANVASTLPSLSRCLSLPPFETGALTSSCCAPGRLQPPAVRRR